MLDTLASQDAERMLAIARSTEEDVTGKRDSEDAPVVSRVAESQVQGVRVARMRISKKIKLVSRVVTKRQLIEVILGIWLSWGPNQAVCQKASVSRDVNDAWCFRRLLLRVDVIASRTARIPPIGQLRSD